MVKKNSFHQAIRMIKPSLDKKMGDINCDKIWENQ